MEHLMMEDINEYEIKIENLEDDYEIGRSMENVIRDNVNTENMQYTELVTNVESIEECSKHEEEFRIMNEEYNTRNKIIAVSTRSGEVEKMYVKMEDDTIKVDFGGEVINVPLTSNLQQDLERELNFMDDFRYQIKRVNIETDTGDEIRILNEEYAVTDEIKMENVHDDTQENNSETTESNNNNEAFCTNILEENETSYHAPVNVKADSSSKTDSLKGDSRRHSNNLLANQILAYSSCLPTNQTLAESNSLLANQNLAYSNNLPANQTLNLVCIEDDTVNMESEDEDLDTNFEKEPDKNKSVILENDLFNLETERSSKISDKIENVAHVDMEHCFSNPTIVDRLENAIQIEGLGETIISKVKLIDTVSELVEDIVHDQYSTDLSKTMECKIRSPDGRKSIQTVALDKDSGDHEMKVEENPHNREFDKLHCKVCDEKFTTDKEFKKHVSMHTPDQLVQAYVTNIETKKPEDFLCRICNRSIISKKHFWQHLVESHWKKEEKWWCRICFAHLKKRSSIKSHSKRFKHIIYIKFESESTFAVGIYIGSNKVVYVQEDVTFLLSKYISDPAWPRKGGRKKIVQYINKLKLGTFYSQEDKHESMHKIPKGQYAHLYAEFIRHLNTNAEHHDKKSRAESQCLFCRMCVNSDLLRYHVWYHHVMKGFVELPEVPLYECVLCKQTHVSKHLYRLHMRDHLLDPDCRLVVRHCNNDPYGNKSSNSSDQNCRLSFQLLQTKDILFSSMSIKDKLLVLITLKSNEISTVDKEKETNISASTDEELELSEGRKTETGCQSDDSRNICINISASTDKELELSEDKKKEMDCQSDDSRNICASISASLDEELELSEERKNETGCPSDDSRNICTSVSVSIDGKLESSKEIKNGTDRLLDDFRNVCTSISASTDDKLKSSEERIKDTDCQSDNSRNIGSNISASTDYEPGLDEGRKKDGGSYQNKVLVVNINHDFTSFQTNNVHRCDICPDVHISFKAKDRTAQEAFLYHVQYYHHHDGKKGFYCKLCKLLFRTSMSFTSHFSSNHSGMLVNQQNLKFVMGRHSEDCCHDVFESMEHKNYLACSLCCMVFRTTSLLQSHELNFHFNSKSSEYWCKTCGEKFEFFNRLEQHLRLKSHEPLLPYHIYSFHTVTPSITFDGHSGNRWKYIKPKTALKKKCLLKPKTILNCTSVRKPDPKETQNMEVDAPSGKTPNKKPKTVWNKSIRKHSSQLSNKIKTSVNRCKAVNRKPDPKEIENMEIDAPSGKTPNIEPKTVSKKGIRKHSSQLSNKIKTSLNRCKAVNRKSNEFFFKEGLLCEYCGILLHTLGSFKQHIHRHSQKFRCKKCFRYCYDLEKHQQTDCLKCKICGLVYDSNKMLGKHRATHSGSAKRRCGACFSVFFSLKDFIHHKECCRPNRRFMCDICGKCYSYIENLKRHCRIHLEANSFKKYSCSQCFKSYDDEYSLNIHNYLNHRRQNILCERCGISVKGTLVSYHRKVCYPDISFK